MTLFFQFVFLTFNGILTVFPANYFRKEDEQPAIIEILKKNKEYRKQRKWTKKAFVGHRLGRNFSDVNNYRMFGESEFQND